MRGAPFGLTFASVAAETDAVAAMGSGSGARSRESVGRSAPAYAIIVDGRSSGRAQFQGEPLGISAGISTGPAALSVGRQPERAARPVVVGERIGAL